MMKKEKQIKTAAAKLNSMLEDYLSTLDPEERAKRHEDAMSYAARALKSRSSKSYKESQTPASRHLSHAGAKTPRTRAYPS